MWETIISSLSFEPDIHPARLEVFTIRNTRDLEITPLPWRPNFDIIGLGTGKIHVPRTKQNYPVMKPKYLKDALRVSQHFLVLFITSFRCYDLDEFHLIELMHSDHATGAYTGGPGLTSKAGCISAIINRQLFLRQNFLAMNVGHRSFRGWNEIQFPER